MKKLPLSLVAASVSVLSSQASANAEISIDQAFVDEAAVEDIVDSFYNSKSSFLVQDNLVSFAQTLTLNDKPIEIDSEKLLAASEFDQTDATTMSTQEASVRSCYSNCYRNCHGSRGWR